MMKKEKRFSASRVQWRRIFCLLLTAALLLVFVPSAALAEGDTLTLEAFLTAVRNGNGTFDGKGATVRWMPDEKTTVIQRIQNNNAQYQIFRELQHLNISNTAFVYVPADIPAHSDAWNTGTATYSADRIRNAEFQLLNTGNVTFTNCSFTQVIVSPFGNQADRAADKARSATITGCTFKDVYNAYAIKDIYPATATITGNTFTNCSGCIYFEGSVARDTLTITGNTFEKADQYAAAGKENTRGLIQFSSPGQMSGVKLTISGNTISGNTVAAGLPVLRQLCTLSGVTVQGWTPGEAFSTKVDKAEVALPAMPSDQQNLFIGWLKDNQGELIAAGTSVGTGMYYAQWKQSAVVSYDLNGGSAASGVDYDDQTVEPGTTVTVKAAPTRQGYTFLGWSDGSKTYQPDDKLAVQKSVKLTAQWSKNGAAETPDEPTDIPKTGDHRNVALWFGLLLLSGIGITVTTVYGKKKFVR